MLHFLYCFDKNYNKQAFTSIFSLLQAVDNKITIHIISNQDQDNILIPNKIKFHDNLSQFYFYKIQLTNLNLYNLKEAHVTEATFYRLFLEDYIEIDDYITYLDCDIICLSNPLNQINNLIEKLELENKMVAFNTEIKKSEEDSIFKNLDLKGENYFNAGVMVFNSKKWRQKNIKFSSINLIKKLKNKAIFWDQDILNVIFDKEYYELPNELNCRIQNNNNTIPVFYHFAGKFKPWSINGAFQKYGFEFHSLYRQIYKQKYLITTSNTTNGLNHLKSRFKSRDIQFNLEGITFLFYSLKAILRKTIK